MGLPHDDDTPCPSDEEYDNTLDCESYSRSCGPEDQDQRVLESKDSRESQKSTSSTELQPKVEVEVLPKEEGGEEEGETMACPVPKPRFSRQTTPSSQPSPPVAKPRTVVLSNPSTPDKPSSPAPSEEISSAGPGSRPKHSLRKLQLSLEEKNQLGNLQSFLVDSDSETHGGSSSCSSSSANAGGLPKQEGLDGQEEEGYWSGSTASHMREKRNRRCFRRKEMPNGQTKVRSKFSPWNLSSPKISRDARLSVLVSHPGRVGTFKPQLVFDEQ